MITIPSTIVGFHMSQGYAQRQSVSFSQEPRGDVKFVLLPRVLQKQMIMVLLEDHKGRCQTYCHCESIF
jgi:hypothetical protein